MRSISSINDVLIFQFSFILLSNRNNLDNNQQRLRSPKRQSGTSTTTTSVLNENDVKGNHDDIKYSNAMDRMDIYSDSNEDAIKIGDETTDDDRPPRLPPRPPPRPRNTMNSEAGMMIYSCHFPLFFTLILNVSH